MRAIASHSEFHADVYSVQRKAPGQAISPHLPPTVTQARPLPDCECGVELGLVGTLGQDPIEAAGQAISPHLLPTLQSLPECERGVKLSLGLAGGLGQDPIEAVWVADAGLDRDHVPAGRDQRPLLLQRLQGEEEA